MNNTNLKNSPHRGGVGGGLFPLFLCILLIGCRTAKQREDATNALVAHVACSADSVVHTLDLQFDELDYWLDGVCSDMDSAALPGQGVKHIRIRNGTLNSQASEARLSYDDYKSNVESTHKARDQPSTQVSFNYMVAILLLLLMLITIVRIRLPTR